MAKPDLIMMGPMMPRVLEVIGPHFTVHKLWEAPDREAMLARIGPGIRAMATDGFRGASREVLAKLPNLAIVSVLGVGYDAVDTRYAKERGIIVTNTPDVLNDDVADLTMALLLAAVRQIPEGDRHVRSGAWLKAPMPLTATLRDKTVGMVGFGRIGKTIAKRLAAFDVEIVYHARHRQHDRKERHYANLVEMAREADILIVIVPGGPSTAKLINAAVLEALGPEGLLVNVARGSVVDEAALVAALQSGTLGGAALDVFEAEPKVPEALLSMRHVVLSPHQGSATHHTRNAMAQLVADNLVAWSQGRRPLTPVP
jgi:lactate dehydrogenase-like 2-hydroxyacid dehydrogenase